MATGSSAQSLSPSITRSSNLGILERRISWAFFYRKSISREYNRAYPKKPTGSTFARRVRRVNHNRWLDQRTLLRHEHISIRLLPFIWRKVLAVTTTYTITDSLSIQCEWEVHRFDSESEGPKSTSTTWTIESKGDSLWMCEIYSNGQIDSTFWMRDTLNRRVYERQSTWEDSITFFGELNTTYDATTNSMATSYEVRKPRGQSRSSRSTCKCDAAWRPIRCEFISKDGKPMTSYMYYGDSDVTRKEVILMDGELHQRTIRRARPHRR